MEKETLTRRIKNLLLEARNFELSLNELLCTTSDKTVDCAIPLATKSALCSERLTCSLRHLLYEFLDNSKPEYLLKAADSQGMAIREYGGMFEIELPGLFPKRNQRKSSEYLTDPLYFLFDKYTDKRKIKKLDNAIICFVHEYDIEENGRAVRDYDNLELKQVLDVIATFLLVDDSGLCCDTFNMTAISDENKTRIFVMPREYFTVWLNEINHLNTVPVKSDEF